MILKEATSPKFGWNSDDLLEIIIIKDRNLFSGIFPLESKEMFAIMSCFDGVANCRQGKIQFYKDSDRGL